MTDRNDKKEMPEDMAEDSVLSADGVNPVAHNEDAKAGKNASEDDGFTLKYPGAVPPSYFPGFPGGPSIG